MILSASQLFDKLNNDLKIIGSIGKITFNLAGINVDITTNDIVGVTLQAWLKKYMEINNIYFKEPGNTQQFPDFILSNIDPDNNYLEVKAFNYNASPGFDIANFESYCTSLLTAPNRINADYLIFGYSMVGSVIRIERVWLKKIWQITCSSSDWPLKVQVKRGMIYNIRPSKWYGNSRFPSFVSKNDFLSSIYKTLKKYEKTTNTADYWIKEINQKYNT